MAANLMFVLGVPALSVVSERQNLGGR